MTACLLNKAVIQHADSLGKVLVVHAEDDVQFVGALVDHADVDARFTQRSKELTGNTGAESHLPANGGDHSDIVVDIQGIGLSLFLDLRHDGVQILFDGVGGQNNGNIVVVTDGNNISIESDKNIIKDESLDNTESAVAVNIYVLNTNSKKIHYPDCKAVNSISDYNKQTVNDSVANLEKQGYTKCGICKPE